MSTMVEKMKLETVVNLPEGSRAKGSRFNETEAFNCKELNAQGKLSGKEIHRGSFGRIYAICDLVDDPKCDKKVVKIILVDKKEEADDLQRELYIFHLLQNTGLTPRIYRTFGCGTYFYIVLERFDMDMYKVGTLQWQNPMIRAEFSKQLDDTLPLDFANRGCLLYTKTQMARMFDIARELGEKYGVIHGDLKADQYLYRNNKGLWQSSDIVVTDFGFSGTSTKEPGKWHAKLGWHHWAGCGSTMPLPPLALDGDRKAQEAFAKGYNVFQLWFYFAYLSCYVWIIDETTKKFYYFPHHEWTFAGTRWNVPPRIREGFFNLFRCPAITIDEYYEDLSASSMPIYRGPLDD